MIGLLRLVGLVNAAVWFGAALFYTIAIQLALRSSQLEALLGARFFPYYSGAIGLLFRDRYFDLNLACSLVACLHLFGEWLYLGKHPRRFWLGFLLGVLCLSIFQSYWLQPRVAQWHRTAHATSPLAETRESAGRSVRIWNGFFQVTNLVMVGGLAVYLWRVANPADSARFVSSGNFRS